LPSALPGIRVQAEPALIAPRGDRAPIIEQVPRQSEPQPVKLKVKDSPVKDDWARVG
jgi:hypothetical protein